MTSRVIKPFVVMALLATASACAGAQLNTAHNNTAAVQPRTTPVIDGTATGIVGAMEAELSTSRSEWKKSCREDDGEYSFKNGIATCQFNWALFMAKFDGKSAVSIMITVSPDAREDLFREVVQDIGTPHKVNGNNAVWYYQSGARAVFLDEGEWVAIAIHTREDLESR